MRIGVGELLPRSEPWAMEVPARSPEFAPVKTAFRGTAFVRLSGALGFPSEIGLVALAMSPVVNWPGRIQGGGLTVEQVDAPG